MDEQILVATDPGPQLPTGVVTFLLTDMEQSTSLWEANREVMTECLLRHDELVAAVVSGHGGRLLKTKGEGDSTLSVFQRASEAAAAAIELQMALRQEPWSSGTALSVRIAVHTGEALERAADYYGPTVNRAARLRAIAHGGQVVCSESTAALVRADLLDGAYLLDLGEHRVRDIQHPIHVFQLCHPLLPRTFPRLRSTEANPTNLAAPATAFVGRDDEVRQTVAALEKSPLVTLAGLPGVGKTRLSLRVASEVLSTFTDGVWVIDASGASDLQDLEEISAGVLGVQQPPGLSLMDCVLSFLRSKHLLLVLDNCEHIIEPITQFLETVLRTTTSVRVLATSRQPIHFPTEQVLTLAPLVVPDDQADIEILGNIDSVRLFVERARALRPGFVLTPTNAGAVAELCRRLDGLPLAIELAAARVQAMTPTEIVSRLDQRFELLTGGAHSPYGRHRTLRGAVDWSYQLLSEPERRLLRRMSVCVGGFDLAAAEVLAAAAETRAGEVADILGCLVDQSLVIADDFGGESRYRMLETIRQYGRDQLTESGELEVAREAHSGYYSGLALRAGSGLKGPAERSWIERVERELDNLRAAVAWALETGRSDLALATLASLGLQGLRIEPAVGSWADSIVSSPAVQSDHRYPAALAFLAWVRLRDGRSDDARRLAHDATVLLDIDHADPLVICRVMAAVTAVEMTLGLNPSQQAQTWLVNARSAGDLYEEALAGVMVGAGKQLAGESDFLETVEEALRVARLTENPSAIAYCLHFLALSLSDQEPARALSLIDEARLFAEAALNTLALVLVDATRSALLSKTGAHRAAAGAFLDSARRAFRDGHLDQQAMSLWGVAGSLAAAHRAEPAAVLKGWVESVLGGQDSVRNLNLYGDAVQALADLPRELGEQRFASLLRDGAGLRDEAVLQYADEHIRRVDEDNGSRLLAASSDPEVVTAGPSLHLGESSAARSEREFIGRERELALLVWTIEAAKAGRGEFVLLTGEAGIGKTRLSEELEVRARASGMRVLWGRCWDAGGAPSFWPWIQIFRSYLRNAGPQILNARPQRAALIAQLVPELAETVDGIAGVPPLDPDSARFALFDAACSCLVDAAAQDPLVVILDDLHAADPSSLLLLQFVVRTVHQHPILVVGTYRDEPTPGTSHIDALLADIGREGRRFALGGLSEAEVAQLIQASAGTRPSASITSAVYETTEGNPFFIHEVIALLLEQGGVSATQLPSGQVIPSGIRDVVSRHLSRLPEETQEILTVASVLGRTFDLDLLERVSGRPRGQLLDALQKALNERVIQEVLRTLGRYTFTHALIRESLYRSIPVTRRGSLHASAAESIFELAEGDVSARTSELAHHAYEAAVAGGDADYAVELAVVAGRQASASLAYEDAVAHYQRGIDLLTRTSHSARRLCELQLLLADALKAAGQGTEATDAYIRAGELAKSLGDSAALAEAALGWGGDVGLTGGLVNTKLLLRLEEALDALPREDSVLRASLLARCALERLFAGDAERVASLSRQAVSMARRVGHPATLAYVLHVRSYTLLGPDDSDERRALAPEITKLAQVVGDIQLAVQGHGWGIQASLELGDRAGVMDELEAVRRLTDELGQPAYRYWATLFRATLALLEGDIAEAESLAHEALSVGEGPFQANAPLTYGAQLFAIRREQGRLGELAELLEGFVGAQPGLPVWRAGLALALLDAGRDQAARDELERLSNDGFSSIPRDLNWLLALALLSEVTSRLGDRRRADVLYDFLQPYAGRNLAVVQGIYYAGSVDYYLGILAAVSGRRDTALEALEAALAGHEAIGASAWSARTKYQLGSLLIGSDPERAKAMLAEARSSAREIGMAGLLAQIEETELAAATSAKQSLVPEEAVFRREGDIWTISYNGRLIRTRDIRGLRYLAQLLAHPRREFHVRELLGTAGGAAGARAVAPDSDAGVLLDEKAKRDYRRRIVDLNEELDEAERWSDDERAAKARAEIEAIAGQLASAVGLGGKDRRAGAEAERARSAVSKRIHDAIERLNADHEELGRHLRASVRTGYFCSYEPEALHQPRWEVEH